MESKKFNRYDSPKVKFFGVKYEGVICASYEQEAIFNGFNEEVDW